MMNTYQILKPGLSTICGWLVTINICDSDPLSLLRYLVIYLSNHLVCLEKPNISMGYQDNQVYMLHLQIQAKFIVLHLWGSLCP